MANFNVLVVAAAEQAPGEADLQARLISLLEADHQVNALAVRLPRAEAMLAPRLIGLWDRLVFIGTTASPSVPLDVAVIQHQAQLLDALPPLVVVGRAADLWPGWSLFQTVIGRPGGAQSIDPTQADAVQRVVTAMQLQHSDSGNRVPTWENAAIRSDV